MLSLKGNQGNLLEDIDNLPLLRAYAVWASVDGDHGRIENAHDPSDRRSLPGSASGMTGQA